jgi:hypothetical protein
MAPQPAFSGSINDVISRSAKQRLRSKQRRNPWIAIDFGPSRRLLPKHYTIRHGGHGNEDPLRNWELQGSDDGETWETIRVHINDESLKGEYGTASWAGGVCVCVCVCVCMHVFQEIHAHMYTHFFA